MAKTFKALSALLAYPTAELQAAAAELRQVIAAEALLTDLDQAALAPLIEEIGSGDLYDLQERYTLLFDRSRALSLHLFEHVHGDSRDRGQAMVDLAGLYERYGCHVVANELPDFLPLFLEFLSVIPEADARAFVAEPEHVLRELEDRLGRRRSPYAAVFRALVALGRGRAAAAGEPVSAAPDVVLAVDEVEELADLDAEWEETAVTFGPGDPAVDACGRTRLMTRLRAARRSVVHPDGDEGRA
ncbi:respiratory nitrate reductase chaperone NarJ [Tepidamorphus gemmatus]|uniref:Respiratory nitrate reductase chaperone NarJ n=1 Tax=Tepidamorphus gemmatus TaxID=747076 RepID=A0A4R3LXU9_9HYPH|nr:nitrate reductase molybdenum cofactor assembly chaperone [Tepidamorphus gemmatus]TCT05403.1 respiratory nitrate reductase chaperone NarJ [Tepidamorphus gemmatus]